jgi:uncharacterized membrane protein YsdA (DUF1294 family)
MEKYIPFIIYFAVISFITAVVTAIDKYKAKKGSFRISEKALFILALLGGSLSEYLTMRLIRHKTLHKRFMIGLPLIMLLQLTVIILSSIYILK